MSEEKNSEYRSPFDKFLDALSYVCTVICGVSLVVLTVIFGWLVYGRYVLNATPTWVEQVSLLLIVLIAFLGASVGIHKNTHLGVSFFREIAPRPVRRVFEFISHVTLIVFGGTMAFYSYQLVLFKWSTLIPLIHVPEGLRAIPIMLCGVFTLLFSVGHLIHFFKGIEEIHDVTE
ncbi:MAG: TRAP transporter small permease [Rhizobiaceae bacterium]|nr:TRAP transporter small permease [Rhizobiaceae bacterium]